MLRNNTVLPTITAYTLNLMTRVLNTCRIPVSVHLQVARAPRRITHTTYQGVTETRIRVAGYKIVITKELKHDYQGRDKDPD